MPTKVTCKHETDDLTLGETYEVLAAKAWGFLIRIGRKTGWYSKDLFIVRH